jgi:hypothetical protein
VLVALVTKNQDSEPTRAGVSACLRSKPSCQRLSAAPAGDHEPRRLWRHRRTLGTRELSRTTDLPTSIPNASPKRSSRDATQVGVAPDQFTDTAELILGVHECRGALLEIERERFENRDAEPPLNEITDFDQDSGRHQVGRAHARQNRVRASPVSNAAVVVAGGAVFITVVVGCA